MQKIPSLFVRDWNGDRSRVTREVNPECRWVSDGEGRATQKFDGTAVLIKDARLWKRYDAKNGKVPPPTFVPAQPSPDDVTGHWPGWLPVGDEPESKWHKAAFGSVPRSALAEMEGRTYELCGPHFQTNPENLAADVLIEHGCRDLDWVHGGVPRDYDGIEAFLAANPMEGIVWWHPDGRRAKIKRTDFGLPWPVRP